MPKMSMSCKVIRRGGISAMVNHDERRNVDKWCREAREAVDPSLSHLNVHIIGADVGEDLQCDIAGCDMARASKGGPQNDRVGLELAINTWLPEQYRRGKDDPPLTKDERQALLKDPEFLSHLVELTETLKREGCVSGVLHMDERVPHVHAVLSVRVKNGAKRSKKSEYLLNYHKIYGDSEEIVRLGRARGARRQEMESKLGVKYDSGKTAWGQLQTRIYEAVYEPRGYERGELASDTGIIGRTPHEYRRDQAAARERSRVDAEISRIRAEADAEIANVLGDYRSNVAAVRSRTRERLRDYGEKKKKEEEEEKKRLEKQYQASIDELERQQKEQLGAYAEEQQQILNDVKEKIDRNIEQELSSYEESQKQVLKDRQEEYARYMKEELDSLDERKAEFEKRQAELNKMIDDDEKDLKDKIKDKTESIKKQLEMIDRRADRVNRAINAAKPAFRKRLSTLNAYSKRLGGIAGAGGILDGLLSLRKAVLADRRLAGDRRLFGERQRLVHAIDDAVRAARESEVARREMSEAVEEAREAYGEYVDVTNVTMGV